MSKKLLSAAFATAIVGVAGFASADTYTFDISGLSVDSDYFDEFPTLIQDLGVGATITGVSFDVNYESFTPSWRSEVVISLDTDLGDFFDLFMEDYGAPDSSGNHAASDNIGSLALETDGLVALTLWDGFPDDDAIPDFTFGPNSSVTITYTPVPEPVSFVAVAGLAGLGLRRRR